MFLMRNSNLTLVNSLDLCEGLITRIRRTKDRTEKSILDFFIVCDKVRPFLKKMVIDEARQHVLTNFNPIRAGGKAIETDHNTEFLRLNIQYQKKKQDRVELFNFKNVESQENFLTLTSQTQNFSDCFKQEIKFEEQANKWKKTLDSVCHQAFKKVRITPYKPQVTKISKLMEERKSMKLKIKMTDDKQKCEEFLNQIEIIEYEIGK